MAKTKTKNGSTSTKTPDDISIQLLRTNSQMYDSTIRVLVAQNADLRARAENAELPKIDLRKKLLARVAGNVASGIAATPSEVTSSPEAIAAVAVDVAEEILKKIGL